MFVAALAECKNLETLGLQTCLDLVDISSLGQCPKLCELILTQCLAY